MSRPVIEPSVEIADRVDFPLLCNARGHRLAIEVGVEQGVFARQFLDRWTGEYMFLIDPYEPYGDSPYDRTMDMLVAVAALTPAHHGRFRFVRARSPEIEPHVSWKEPPVPPDFIYIDAAHDYESVAADIAAWWPRLSERGVLAGHDYEEAHPGVMRAVGEFATREEAVIRLTSEPDFPRSWYAYRTEPAVLIRQHFTKGEVENPHCGGPARG